MCQYKRPIWLQLRRVLSLLALNIHIWGCPGVAHVAEDDGGSSLTATWKLITIKGLVVDWESCLTSSGCKAVPNIKVSLLSNDTVSSEPTPPAGTFELNGIPAGLKHYLLLQDTKNQYLPCLQAEPINTKQDILSIELYVLKNGSLISKLKEEANINIKTQALYLGQVIDSKMAAVRFTMAQIFPNNLNVYYIQKHPDIKEQEDSTDKTVLYDQEWHNGTGKFGEFLVSSETYTGDAFILLTNNDYNITPMFIPLSKNYIVLGRHNAQEFNNPTPKDGGGVSVVDANTKDSMGMNDSTIKNDNMIKKD